MSAKTHSFVALYVGDSIANARLISASADSSLVRWVAERLLHDEQQETESDAHVRAIQEGRRKALSLIVGCGN